MHISTRTLTTQEMVDRNIKKSFTINPGLLWIVALIFVVFTGTPHLSAEKINCSRFATQGDAQRTYNENPTLHAKLDRDHDGIVCEHLPIREIK